MVSTAVAAPHEDSCSLAPRATRDIDAVVGSFVSNRTAIVSPPLVVVVVIRVSHVGRASCEIKPAVINSDSEPRLVFELKVESFAIVVVVVVVQNAVRTDLVVPLDIKKPSRLRVFEIAHVVIALAVIFRPLAPSSAVIRAPMPGSRTRTTFFWATTTLTSQVIGTIWFTVTWVCNPVEN